MSEQRSDAAPEAAPVRRGGHPAAFIIDDDALMVGLLERRLAKRGLAAVAYDEPLRLVADLARSAPACIVTDLEMHPVDGIELTRAARRAGYGGVIAVVTASRDRDRLLEAVRAGADEVLAKPVRELELDLLVEKAMRRTAPLRPLAPRYEDLLEPLAQGIVLVDEECRLIYANPRAREVLGAASDEAASRLLEQSCAAGVFVKSREGRPAVTYVDTGRRGGEGGGLVGFEVSYLERLLPHPCYLVLLHDFSRERRLDELHARFATYLSHRMRTPLTSVRNAVAILSGKEAPLEGADKERFAEIGLRNVEKLVSSFDELQKLFMIESGELNVCRTLVRIQREIRPVLADLERAGTIKGFRVSGSDILAFTGHGRLRDFLAAAAEALGRWLGAAPFIECHLSELEEMQAGGGTDSRIRLAIRAAHGPCPGRASLRDFLSCEEAHRGLVLERIAGALDGEIAVCPRNSVSLELPADPPFCSAKDFIHPLHLMLERAELDAREFHVVTLRLAGGGEGGAPRFRRILAESLGGACRGAGIVAKGEEPHTYSVFIVGESSEGVSGLMQRVRDRFQQSCADSGEELCPAVRWEIRYSKAAGAVEARELACLEEPV